MLVAYKLLLGPILIVQGRRLRATALRLPEASGPREGVIQSTHSNAKVTAPLRLLFVGDSSAAGVGVDNQSQALAQQVCQRLRLSTQRSVAWQIVAKSGVTTREAIDLVTVSELQQADIIVSALGVNDVTAQVSSRHFVNDYAQLLDYVRTKTNAKLVIISGLPPMGILPNAPQPLRWYLGRYASRLDKGLQTLCASDPCNHFVSLRWASPADMAKDGFHPGVKQYQQWAEVVAGVVYAQLNKVRTGNDH